MTPLDIFLLWIIIGFFVNYKLKNIPFTMGDSGGKNLPAIVCFIFSPLAFALCLIYIVFFKDWGIDL